MPKKGHRAASRQAQMQRRKRRGRPRTEEFAAGPTAPQTLAGDAESDDEAIPAIRPVATAVEPRPRTSRRVRPGASAAVADARSHLGGELRQAAIIAALIGVILAVLTVLLG
jgi:hypothetical protein